MPQQAGVVGLTTNVPLESTQAAAGEDEHADGFQQQQSSRVASGGNRGRRGGPRGAPFGGPAPGGFRRPRGFGGPRYGAAPAASEEEGAAAQSGEGGAALNESGETEERLDRNFERRGGRGFGGYRGNAGYARRGGFRRGPAAPGAGFFEDGTGRKREFERHSGSDVTYVPSFLKCFLNRHLSVTTIFVFSVVFIHSSLILEARKVYMTGLALCASKG